MGLNITVFLVVTDWQGNFKAYESLDGATYSDVQKLGQAISQKHAKLAQQYPEAEYSVHVGVADSLPNFLRSFPEIRRAHEVVSA